MGFKTEEVEVWEYDYIHADPEYKGAVRTTVSHLKTLAAVEKQIEKHIEYGVIERVVGEPRRATRTVRTMTVQL
jgi:hypothetical protein